MTVPVYKRTESKTEYLNLLYDLNIKIGEIVANGPSKYINSYGDYLIRASCSALQYAQTANRIYMSKNTSIEDYNLRRSYLQRIKGLVDNISTISSIYLDLSLRTKIKKSDIMKRQQRMGEICYDIIEKVNGVMRHDNKIIKQQYNK